MGLTLSDHPELFETRTSGVPWDTVHSHILTRSPSSEYKSTKRLPQRWISHLNSSGVHESLSWKKSQVAGFTKTSWSQEPATTYSLVAPGKCDFILTFYIFLWIEISFLKHLKDKYFAFCNFLWLLSFLIAYLWLFDVDSLLWASLNLMLSLSLLGKMTLYGPASFLSKSGSESRQAPGNSSTVNLGIKKAVKEIKNEILLQRTYDHTCLSYDSHRFVCQDGTKKPP